MWDLPGAGMEPVSCKPAGELLTTQFSQSLSGVWLFVTPWTAARQASLSITNSWSLLKLIPIKSVMPSNHLVLSYPVLPLPSIFPSIRVFTNESVLHIMWPKDWSFSFSISPSDEYSGLISFRIDHWTARKALEWFFFNTVWRSVFGKQGRCRSQPDHICLPSEVDDIAFVLYRLKLVFLF